MSAYKAKWLQMGVLTLWTMFQKIPLRAMFMFFLQIPATKRTHWVEGLASYVQLATQLLFIPLSMPNKQLCHRKTRTWAFVCIFLLSGLLAQSPPVPPRYHA